MGNPRTGWQKLFDYHIVKNAVNRYLTGQVGGDQRPVFIDDIASVSPELNDLANHFETIRREFDAIVTDGTELPAYHDVDPGEIEISGSDGTDRKWGVFLLHLLGHEPAANCRRCPETCRLLSRIPGLIQAFFSVLDPGKSVPEHCGPYVGYLRYHLALQVPDDNPPSIRVRDQTYTWREGEGVLFDDSWPHEVINHSRQPRAVLIVDVRRPMTGVPHLVNRFMIDVLASCTYGRKVARRAERFVSDPGRPTESPQRRAA